MTLSELQSLLELAGEAASRSEYEAVEHLAGKVLFALGADIEDEKNGATSKVGTIEIIHAEALRLLGVVARFRGDYPRALEKFQSALTTIQPESEPGRTAQILVNIANVHFYQSDFGSALNYYQQANTLYSTLGMKGSVAITTANMGIVYSDMGDPITALEFYRNALLMHEELDDIVGVAHVTGNMGVVYNDLGVTGKALEYYRRALTMHEELGNRASSAGVMCNIGIIYQRLGDFESALEYCSRALNIYDELGIAAEAAQVTGNIGGIYLEKGDYPQALEYLQKALELDELLGARADSVYQLQNIGQLYAADSYSEKDYEKAEAYLLRANALNEELGMKVYAIHFTLADLYRKQQRWEEADSHFVHYVELRDEIRNEETKKQADALAYERKIAESEKMLAVERARAEEHERSIAELTEVNSALAETLRKVEVLNANLSAVNQAKNDVIGIVAHDLKNPLAGIILGAETITTYREAMTLPDIFKYVDNIRLTATRMNEILRNLLDIHALDTGGLNINPVFLDIIPFLHAAIDEYGRKASKKEITFYREFGGEVPLISADSVALLQVLDNLISNAIKFSPPGKKITISCQMKDGRIQVIVRDEGQGISAGDMPHLFGRFRKLSAQPTGGEHSTGLGLAIAKQLTELMNGRLWCESEYGSGAAFILEFPAAVPQNV